MSTINDIRDELERAVARRSQLWLWAQARDARARARFGSPELILTRARTEERLERERRLSRAA